MRGEPVSRPRSAVPAATYAARAAIASTLGFRHHGSRRQGGLCEPVPARPRRRAVHGRCGYRRLGPTRTASLKHALPRLRHPMSVGEDAPAGGRSGALALRRRPLAVQRNHWSIRSRCHRSTRIVGLACARRPASILRSPRPVPAWGHLRDRAPALTRPDPANRVRHRAVRLLPAHRAARRETAHCADSTHRACRRGRRRRCGRQSSPYTRTRQSPAPRSTRPRSGSVGRDQTDAGQAARARSSTPGSAKCRSASAVPMTRRRASPSEIEQDLSSHSHTQRHGQPFCAWRAQALYEPHRKKNQERRKDQQAARRADQQPGHSRPIQSNKGDIGVLPRA
jgi:hypothetical protein